MMEEFIDFPPAARASLCGKTELRYQSTDRENLFVDHYCRKGQFVENFVLSAGLWFSVTEVGAGLFQKIDIVHRCIS
jgi:hypothetical protein